MGLKIEVDFETADLVIEEGLKNSLDINAGIIVRLIRELTDDSDEFEFEDLHDCILNYASIYNTMRYYFISGEAIDLALNTLRRNVREE